MQLNFVKLRGLALLIVMTLSPPGFAGALDSHRELVSLLSSLYQRYAWVAVFAIDSPAGRVPLARASRQELSEVFAADLALAIWNDSQGADKRGEAGRLDFDILFDSQDPGATDLVIEPGKLGDEAQVCFKDVADARRCVTFTGAPIKGSMRITDIRYPGGQSLRQILKFPGIRANQAALSGRGKSQK